MHTQKMIILDRRINVTCSKFSWYDIEAIYKCSACIKTGNSLKKIDILFYVSVEPSPNMSNLTHKSASNFPIPCLLLFGFSHKEIYHFIYIKSALIIISSSHPCVEHKHILLCCTTLWSCVQHLSTSTSTCTTFVESLECNYSIPMGQCFQLRSHVNRWEMCAHRSYQKCHSIPLCAYLWTWAREFNVWK